MLARHQVIHLDTCPEVGDLPPPVVRRRKGRGGEGEREVRGGEKRMRKTRDREIESEGTRKKDGEERRGKERRKGEGRGGLERGEKWTEGR